MAQKVKAKDILLLLLYLPGCSKENNEPIKGRTRITKMMFLFEKELFKNFNNISEESLPSFFAYNYGPFSKDLLDDIRFFKNIGFIEEKITNNEISDEAEVEEYINDVEEDIEYSENIGLEEIGYPGDVEYSLSEKGIKYVVEKLIDNQLFSKQQLDLLQKFKCKINSLSLNQLLTYVYKKYTDMTTKSVIRDQILK